MERLKAPVAIIGAGPAGLLLARLLKQRGVDCVIIEARSADYVAARVRAGVLESTTVDILDSAEVGERLHKESLPMTGIDFFWDAQHVRVPFDIVSSHSTVYGQTEITRDLMDAREFDETPIYYEATNVVPRDWMTHKPRVTFTHDGHDFEVSCDFIAACDGGRGVCRQSIPADQMTVFEHAFPFAWLALLAEAPPVAKEVAWVNHPDGFAMCSLRSDSLSRYYIQVDAETRAEDWSAEAFWSEFARRLPERLRANLQTGPALEMSVTRLRSMVMEPLSFGRMYFAGDSAHLVPPIGAKGLNLALGDAFELGQALGEHIRQNDSSRLSAYSATCLDRIWRAVRFSWWMANLTHVFSDTFGARRLQVAEFDYIAQSKAAQVSIAENFCGVQPLGMP